MDLDFTRATPMSSTFTLKWLAGLRAARYEETQSFLGNDGSLDYLQDKTFKTDGAGLRVGVAGVFGLTKHFGLEGSMAMSFLQARTEGLSTATFPTGSIQTISGKDDAGMAIGRSSLQELFDLAASKDLLTFVETLVRVDGISYNTLDPLIELRSRVEMNTEGLLPEDFLAHYREVAAPEDALALVANLINCVLERPYDVSPFGHLRSGAFPKIVFPSAYQVAQETQRMARAAGLSSVASLIALAFAKDVLAASEGAAPKPSHTRSKAAYENFRAFILSLLNSYSRVRKSFLTKGHFYKMPPFEVLELDRCQAPPGSP